jgi:hypothetical protein
MIMKRITGFILLGISTLAAALLLADTPANTGPIVEFAATSANVSGAPDNIRIEILRWSTDEERARLQAAWNLEPSGGAGGGAAKGGAGKGKGGGKGGGGAAKGGGGGAPIAAAVTPDSALADALQGTTTVGYLWSSEMAGYALRYAAKIENPDKSQRIILVTERRLGAFTQKWNPTGAGDANTYEFSVIELRLNAKGEGEGKASIVGKVAPDAAAKIVTLENYDMLPVVFRGVHVQAGKP